MRIGQTSAVLTASKFVSYGIGFLTTVYFARLLGPDVLGTYFLIIATVTWLELLGLAGICSAVSKRVSEGTETGAYVAAGLLLQSVFILVLSAVVYACRDWLNQYVGTTAAEFVVLILVTNVLYIFIAMTLKGNHQVHLYSFVDVFKIGSQRLAQFVAVVFGFQLFGLLAGHVIGTVLATIAGVYVIAISLSRPKRKHFVGLLSYAKYAWFNRFQSKSFSWMDTIVMGFFVTTNLIGIYEIAWNIASFLALSGTAISQTLFPAISRESANENVEWVRSYTTDALTYCGVLLMPGLIGGLIVGEQILAIYGPEFRVGVRVLALLLVAQLIYAYLQQFTNALNAIDRPDLAFKSNASFVMINLALNVALVSLFGWIGAAIATAASATIGAVVSYRYARSIIRFSLPMDEIGRQAFAALVMGGVVMTTKYLVELAIGDELTIPLTFGVVCIGAAVYFLSLATVSGKFRETIRRNAPIRFPLPR